MDYINEINIRKSSRTFLKTPIETDKLIRLKELIESINDESNLSITLEEDASQAFEGFGKSYGLFKGVRTIIVLKGNVEDEHLKEKCGYYGEKIVLEASRLGLGSCWVGGTFQKANKIFEKIKSDEKLVCVIPVGDTPDNPSKREKLIRTLMHRKTKPIEEMYISKTTPPKWFLDGMNAVAKAPTAVNSQKVVFEFSDERVKASVPSNSGFDLVDLGICKLHFEIATSKKLDLGNQ